MTTTTESRAVTTATIAPAAKPSGFGLMLTPETIEAAKSLAQTLASSGLVPKAFAGKPDAILIAGAMGHRLGLDIFTALNGIAVINDRPTLWGDAMLAVCQAHPEWLGMQVEKDDKAGACTVTISRKGHTSPYVGSFSMEEAGRAKLADKPGPWSQYPQRMVELRARSYALRAAFADALAGIACREEMEDVVREVEHTVIPNAQPAKERTIVTAETAGTTDTTPTLGELVDKAKAEAQPVEPTKKDVDAAARKLAADFGNAKAGPEIIDIIKKLGVTKLSEIQPEQVRQAMKFLDNARIALSPAEGGAK